MPRQSKSSQKNAARTLKKWNTAEEIPLDLEDEFHTTKDKILLEPEYSRYSDDDDEDEVFALKGMPEDSHSEEEENVAEEDYGEQQQISKKKTKKKKRKETEKSKSRSEKDTSDEEEESWGKTKASFYSSNADQLDSDDEEGHELEEQEAIRLQTKSRHELQDEDFGLDDTLESEKGPEADDPLDPVPSVLPSLPTDKQSVLRHLEKTNPEALALASDWEDIAYQLQRTRLKMENLDEEKFNPFSLGIVHLHYQALLSYSTLLAFYFHLRASPKYALRPALLESHPIMQRLLTLKQSLHTLEELDIEIDDGSSDSMDVDDDPVDEEKLWRSIEVGGLEPNELEHLLQDAEAPASPKPKDQKRARKKRKIDTEDTTSAGKPVAHIFDLVEPVSEVSKSTSSRRKDHVFDDPLDIFGEATALTTVDAADKSARRKSLRFHTSKIESANSRRKGARNQVVGGDDDIPYREMKKDKDARLMKEALKRAENQKGDDLALNDGDLEMNNPQVGRKRTRLDEEDESPPDYYELVQKKSKEAKARKKAEYEETRISRVPLEEESSGQRTLTRAILKNKGLTPHRPKAVRNPRVKKRQRFDKAKRKVASQKAVFKGGLSESKGRYDGEKTGISKVVKSIRLG